jgi:hypothetical protein
MLKLTRLSFAKFNRAGKSSALISTFEHLLLLFEDAVPPLPAIAQGIPL